MKVVLSRRQASRDAHSGGATAVGGAVVRGGNGRTVPATIPVVGGPPPAQTRCGRGSAAGGPSTSLTPAICGGRYQQLRPTGRQHEGSAEGRCRVAVNILMARSARADHPDVLKWRTPDDRSPVEGQRLLPREPQFGLTFDIVFEHAPRRFGPPRRTRVAVDVLDLSLGGALLRTPSGVRLDVGTRIQLVAGKGQARAEVRHTVSASPESSWCFYGVRFDSANEPFREMVSARVSRERNRLHEVWLTAT